jgi:hypothetical protein
VQEIAEEECALRAEMAELAQGLESVATEAAQLDAAGGVLEKLGARLREPLSLGGLLVRISCYSNRMNVPCWSVTPATPFP